MITRIWIWTHIGMKYMEFISVSPGMAFAIWRNQIMGVWPGWDLHLDKSRVVDHSLWSVCHVRENSAVNDNYYEYIWTYLGMKCVDFISVSARADLHFYMTSCAFSTNDQTDSEIKWNQMPFLHQINFPAQIKFPPPDQFSNPVLEILPSAYLNMTLHSPILESKITLYI